jgi:hypothetical protein
MDHHVGILVHGGLPISECVVGLLTFFPQAFVGLLALWFTPSLIAVPVLQLLFLSMPSRITRPATVN